MLTEPDVDAALVTVSRVAVAAVAPLRRRHHHDAPQRHAGGAGRERRLGCFLGPAAARGSAEDDSATIVERSQRDNVQLRYVARVVVEGARR